MKELIIKNIGIKLLCSLFLWLFIFFGGTINAQIGGITSFDFLKLSPSARITAVGGGISAVFDKDPTVNFRNPALMNDSMHSCLSASVVNYISDISYGTFCYSHTLNARRRDPHFSGDSINPSQTKHRIFGGIQYFGYGKFTEADMLGITGNTYGINSLAITAGYGRSFGNFHLGINAKVAQTVIYQSGAWAMGVDFGALYYSPKNEFGVSLAIQNIGGPLSTFQKTIPTYDKVSQSLPVNVEVGLSKKLPKAPFRFSLLITNLNRPSMIYTDPNAKQEYDLAGNPLPKPNTTVDNLFRHCVFGLEAIITQNFHLRAGYNHQRRRELSSENQAFSLDGFTMGFGLRIYRFNLDYGYARFHAAGGMHQFQISTYLNKTFKKLGKPSVFSQSGIQSSMSVKSIPLAPNVSLDKSIKKSKQNKTDPSKSTSQKTDEKKESLPKKRRSI